ncbi:MAG: SLBB domain-containing protein [Gammaproteobacteria bacterium]|nr:SLBB domain-containing protein [Gammaproteobacteria bacterium]MCF6230099.1 SLBB domain-containing protein [Gammaproteobacteria bacterium]
MFKKLFILLILSTVASSLAVAVPTPQQIQLFQSLSGEEQERLLEQYGVSGDVSPPTQRGNWQDQVNTPQVIPPIVEETVEEREQHQQKQEKISNIFIEPPAAENKTPHFGYDVFRGSPSAFAPAADIPVPSDYIIGPGDEIYIQIFGKENADYSLIVSRDGSLNFPRVGVISVAGLSFDEVKKQLTQRIKKQFIGVQSHISMGTLRSIRIFVMGNVKHAGSYTVSALSTLTNALFNSGGVTPLGSLRRIELKRRGEVISEFDLYDLLMRGDTRADRRLQPGDVIFVPPIGDVVKIEGAVIRPAIYELKGRQTIADVLAFAGGMLPTAYPQASRIIRIDEANERRLLDIDLSNKKATHQQILAGDSITVSSVLDKIENTVLLRGHVERPARYQWFEGMRVSDLIPSIDDLKPQADLQYALIRRETGSERHIMILHVSLGDILRSPNSEKNIEIFERDMLMVFGLYGKRNEMLKPLVEQLRNQGRPDAPEKIVTLLGNVRHSGVYPLTEGMHLSDLVKATVDVLPETDLSYVLVQSEMGAARKLKLKSYDLTENGDVTVDPLLEARDTAYFFNQAESRQDQLSGLLSRLAQQADFNEPRQVVTITGPVKNPGQYPLEEGMYLSDLVRAAGYLKESAYSLEAELSRYIIKDSSTREIEHRVVNLTQILAGDRSFDQLLEPYDSLTIKQLPNWRDGKSVELKGEVRFPGTYAFLEGETLADVMARAGGVTEQAYPQAAIFLREELRIKEQRNLDDMRMRLEREIAAINLEKASMTGAASQGAVIVGNDLASRLESTKALGRLVIDLEAVLSGDERRDIVLKSGDRLIVPSKTQEVSILGEVFHPTSHLYDGSLSVAEYINQSGGLTQRADDARVYVVRANGAVVTSGLGWFKSGIKLKPGDTIIVPLDVDYLSTLRLWTNVSQIVYQLGIAVASWNAVGLL